MKRALLAVLLLAGCGSMSSSSADEPINTTCPVSDEPIGSKPKIVMVGDHKVALCCGGCLDDWDAMSEEAKKAEVDKMLAGR